MKFIFVGIEICFNSKTYQSAQNPLAQPHSNFFTTQYALYYETYYKRLDAILNLKSFKQD